MNDSDLIGNSKQFEPSSIKRKTSTNYWRISFFVVLLLWLASIVVFIYFYTNGNRWVTPSVNIPTSTPSPSVIPINDDTVIVTPSAKFAPFIKKVIITFNGGGEVENYYTSSWFWCAGSNGERVLDTTYSPYLVLAGKTSQGNNVYILKEDAPYPNDQRLIPSTKKTMNYEGENGVLVLQEDWSKFLLNQNVDYPIIIIKDSSENMIMYFRQDYLFLPGC